MHYARVCVYMQRTLLCAHRERAITFGFVSLYLHYYYYYFILTRIPMSFSVYIIIYAVSDHCTRSAIFHNFNNNIQHNIIIHIHKREHLRRRPFTKAAQQRYSVHVIIIYNTYMRSQKHCVFLSPTNLYNIVARSMELNNITEYIVRIAQTFMKKLGQKKKMIG